jgi:hypothetical protein
VTVRSGSGHCRQTHPEWARKTKSHTSGQSGSKGNRQKQSPAPALLDTDALGKEAPEPSKPAAPVVTLTAYQRSKIQLFGLALASETQIPYAASPRALRRARSCRAGFWDPSGASTRAVEPYEHVVVKKRLNITAKLLDRAIVRAILPVEIVSWLVGASGYGDK